MSDRRKRQVIQEARQGQGFFICHKTSGVCCRGFFDSYGWDVQAYQVASRLSAAGASRFVIWIDAAGNEVEQPADAPEWAGRV